jgi:membrane-associated protease RseP (regulator of RpoE activity)
VSTIESCVVPVNAATADGTCPAGAQRAPAFGVLQAGDVIKAIGGTAVPSWNDAVRIIQASAGKPLSITIERSGIERAVTVTPVENQNYVEGTDNVKAVGYLGVGPASHSYYRRDSIVQVPGQIVSQLAVAGHAMVSYPSKIHSLWQTVFEGRPRDQQGAVGIVGLGEIGGQIASTHGLYVRDKIFYLFSLLASVNLLLFFFNLLPLLPLDGGHVAGALLEAVKRGRARLRGRAMVTADTRGAGAAPPERDPIYVDTAQMLPIMYGIASVLVLLTLLVIYADIVKPIHIS